MSYSDAFKAGLGGRPFPGDDADQSDQARQDEPKTDVKDSDHDETPTHDS